MRADNRPFESSLYDKMNCVHRLDVFIPKLKCYTLHILCFHNTKVQMFLLAVFKTRPKQGLWWDHWAGTFLGFLNVSLRAFGAQLRLDRPCKSNWPLLIKKCHVTSRTGGSSWRFWLENARHGQGDPTDLLDFEMFIFIISSIINFYNYLLYDFRKKIFIAQTRTNSNMLPVCCSIFNVTKKTVIMAFSYNVLQVEHLIWTWRSRPEGAALVLLVHLWLPLEHPHLPPAAKDDEAVDAGHDYHDDNYDHQTPHN